MYCHSFIVVFPTLVHCIHHVILHQYICKHSTCCCAAMSSVLDLPTKLSSCQQHCCASMKRAVTAHCMKRPVITRFMKRAVMTHCLLHQSLSCTFGFKPAISVKAVMSFGSASVSAPLSFKPPTSLVAAAAAGQPQDRFL